MIEDSPAAAARFDGPVDPTEPAHERVDGEDTPAPAAVLVGPQVGPPQPHSRARPDRDRMQGQQPSTVEPRFPEAADEGAS